MFALLLKFNEKIVKQIFSWGFTCTRFYAIPLFSSLKKKKKKLKMKNCVLRGDMVLSYFTLIIVLNTI